MLGGRLYVLIVQAAAALLMKINIRNDRVILRVQGCDSEFGCESVLAIAYCASSQNLHRYFCMALRAVSLH